MWFIDVEVAQETSAPPPKKNPGSAPAVILGGLLCASGDTRFLNAYKFSSVFGKRICDVLFQFATRSLTY